MSDDYAFDQMKAGHRVRCLNTAQFYENPRELGQIRTVEDLSRFVKGATEELGKTIAEADRRVTALERERAGIYDDRPEYSVTVDKSRGIVGDDR